MAGFLLSLLVLLSPELTLAPLSAVEPHRAAPGPIDRMVEAVLPQSTRPIDERPIVPEPTEPPATDSELRMVVEPGDLLCFSGAHLHASVPNTSGEARHSVELRTVNLDDRERGRGAPDLDGRAPRVPLHWFRSMESGAPL